MTRDEFNKIYTTIQNEYSGFNGDYDEWYDVLSEYSYEEVLKKVTDRRSSTPPIHTHLIKNLNKEEKIEDWITECDICKQRILIHNNDMAEYEKHYRKCQKIDFIDRMCMKYNHNHIPTIEYYEMSEEELNRRYRKIMDYYVSQPREEILKKI